MRGSVKKRGDTWSIIYRAVDPASGQTKQVWKGGFGTKKAAEDELKELVRKVDEGTWTRPTKQTLAQFLEDDWLPSLDAAVAGGSLKASTVAHYRRLAESHVKPRIGGLLLTRLDAPALNRLYGELLATGRRTGKKKGGPLSPTTVHAVHVTIGRALGDAVRWGNVSRNVARLATPPSPASPEHDGWWIAEQLRTFAGGVDGDRLSALWRLAMTTGMRRGELCGLRWQDVDLEAARLKVASTRVVVDYQVLTVNPKSRASARTIALDPATSVALKAHRRRQLEERMAWGPGWTDSGLVFTQEDGEGFHPERVTRMFQAAAKKAELPVIPLHGLRHSYASAGLRAGVGLKVMQERLGHASLSVTSDIYSHVAPEVDQEAADTTANYIFGA